MVLHAPIVIEATSAIKVTLASTVACVWRLVLEQVVEMTGARGRMRGWACGWRSRPPTVGGLGGRGKVTITIGKVELT